MTFCLKLFSNAKGPARAPGAGFANSTHESPLPNACTHSTFSIDASLFISLVMSTCILSIDTCLRATSVHGSDDSSQSPLLNACTHSTFSTLACCFFDIYLPLAFVTCSCVWHAWFSDDFKHDSPLRTCIHFTLLSAFALLVSLHDESSMGLNSLSAGFYWQSCYGKMPQQEWRAFYCLFTTLFDGVLLLKTLMSPLVQLAPLSGPFLVPQVQVGIRETRLYHPRSGTLP